MSAPARGPLDQAAYQAELAKVEKGLGGNLRALARAQTAEGLAEAMRDLSTALNKASAQLAAITVAARLSGVHQLLQDRIGVAAYRLADSEQAELDARCGGGAYTSKKVQRQLRVDLQPAFAALTQRELVFGGSLPNPGKAPEAERPANGETVVRRGEAGIGRLEITNGTSKDVAISVVPDGKPPREPHVMTYIRAGKAAAITRIGGPYHLYYKSGAEWSSERRQFATGCSFQKFEQAFGADKSWKIDLQRTVSGNAPTKSVEAY
ncbi:hypothetical protein HPO96_13685 [Kribbella sandramycini]|uniref:Uncharacterized protein n=1 Tax=Kribbella sandramycini TaxID=60450 RepID=A0A7Y4P0Q2_9ACTN|nr:hypothetical protein [Kribbella sandramycini]MBB6565027.1 hypothetical protein [Kribbella sandramycini]NOL41299.1 hypothetical protein [Kribbella sandramycini]